MAVTEVRPYPFDVLVLNKGDYIAPEKCEQVAGIRRDALGGRYQLKLLGLRQALERQWERDRGEVITTTVEKDGIRICSDDGAVVTNEKRATQHIRGLRRDLVRQNGVDRSKVSSPELKNVHERSLVRLGAFIAGGQRAQRAALKEHKRNTPGLLSEAGEKK